MHYPKVIPYISASMYRTQRVEVAKVRRPSFFLFVDNYSCNKQVKLDGTSCQTHGRLILVGPNNSLKLTIPYIKNDSICRVVVAALAACFAICRVWVAAVTAILFWISVAAIDQIWDRTWGLIKYQSCHVALCDRDLAIFLLGAKCCD